MNKNFNIAKLAATLNNSLKAGAGQQVQEQIPQEILQKPETNTWQELKQLPQWDKMGFTDKLMVYAGARIPAATSAVMDSLGVEEARRQRWRDSLSAAAEKFNTGWMGKILNVMDIGAEATERTVGLLAQWMNEPIGTETADFKDYWQAGSFTYDFMRLPKFVKNEDGGVRVIQDTELPGAEGFIWARNRISQLVDSGVPRKEALQQVRTELYADMETMNVRAAKQDLLGHMFADPMNWFMGWLKPVDRTKAAALWAKQNKVDMDLAEILMKAGSKDELGKLISEAGIESLDEIADSSRLIDANAVFKARARQEVEEGLRKSNQLMTTADKIAIFMTGGMENLLTYNGVTDDMPLWARNYMSLLADMKIPGTDMSLPLISRIGKLFSQTPDSKAFEVMISLNDALMTKMPKGSVDEAVDFLRQMHMGMIDPKWGHNMLTPEGRGVQLLIRQHITDIVKSKAGWDKIVRERTFLNTLARALTPENPNQTIHRILKSLVEEGPEHMMETFRQAARTNDEIAAVLRNLDNLDIYSIRAFSKMPMDDLGYALKAMSDDVLLGNLRQIVQENVPYTLDLWRIDANRMLMRGLDETLAAKFGIQEMSALRKFSEALKAGQSLAFLKINPGFMVRNFLNNELTMIGRGLSPFVDLDHIDELMEGLGYTPLKSAEAFTMAGDTLQYGAPRVGQYQPGSHIQDVLVGERKFLDNAREYIGKADPGIFNFGEYARKSEEWASKRAFYSGFHEGMRDYFWKPGVSFQPAQEALSGSLRAHLGDEAVSMLDDMIQDVRGEDDFDKLFFRNPEFSPTGLMNKVSEKAKREWGLELPRETYEYLHSNLERILDQAQEIGDLNILDDFFDGMRSKLRNHLQQLTDERQIQRVQYAAGLVKGIGPTSAIPILLGDTFDDLMHAHIGHSMRMARINDMNVPFAQKQIYWRNVLQENEDYWARHWQRFEDTISGIRQSMDDLNIPMDSRFDDMVQEYRNLWEGFFKDRNERYEKFFSQVAKGVEPDEDFDIIRAAVNTSYGEHVDEELELLESLDGMMSDLMRNEKFGDIDIAPSYASWRLQMRQIRKGYRKRTKDFFKAIEKESSPLARSRMFNTYFNQTAEDWQKAAVMQRRGLLGMYGDPDILNDLAEMAPNAYLIGINKNLADLYGLEDFNNHIPNVLRAYMRGDYGTPSDMAKSWARSIPAKWTDDAGQNIKIFSGLDNRILRNNVPTEVLEDALEKRKRFHNRRRVLEGIAPEDLPPGIQEGAIYNIGVVPDGWQQRISLDIIPETVDPIPGDIDGRLYHVTSSRGGVAKSGLLSKGQRGRLGLNDFGLGGGHSDRNVSATYSRAKAAAIRDFYKNAALAAKGEMDVADIIRWYHGKYNQHNNISLEDWLGLFNEGRNIDVDLRIGPMDLRLLQGSDFDSMIDQLGEILTDAYSNAGIVDDRIAYQFLNDMDMALYRMYGVDVPNDHLARMGGVYLTDHMDKFDNFKHLDPNDVEILNVAVRPGLNHSQKPGVAERSGEFGWNLTEAELRLWDEDVWVMDPMMELRPYDGPMPTPVPTAWENLHKGGPMLDVGYDQQLISRSNEMLDMLQYEAQRVAKNQRTILDDTLDEYQKIELKAYLDTVKGNFNQAKTAATAFAGFRRDSALLNYRNRTKFDTLLGSIMPYSFWMTHSIYRWGLHSIDRPAMLANYLRWRKMFQTSGPIQEGMPTRLRNSIRMPVLDPPEWMGDSYWGDPARALFPFDQMAFPYEKYVQHKQDLAHETENMIRDMVDSKEIPAEEGAYAIRTKAGQVWDSTYATVRQSLGANQGAWDIANTFSSVHAPLQWGFNWATGNLDEIGPLTPASRSVKQLYGAFGINPVTGQQGFGTGIWDVGSSIRQQLGLHPFDKWEDYRIDRAIVNLVASDPNITPEMGMRAMIDREGPVFQAGASYAAKQFARADLTEDASAGEKASGVVAFILNQSGIPIYTLPEGEEMQRNLQSKFAQAYFDEYEQDKAGALNDFFKEHPEYEARLALWDPPEQRLKSFLIDQWWAEWNELPTVHKRQIIDTLGPDFESKLINKETRNYEAIQSNELYAWIKAIGADPPGSLNYEVANIEFADDDIAMRAQGFYQLREQKYPQWKEWQDEFFELDEDSSDRRNHPVREYWAWRKEFFHNNPDIIPYVDDDYGLKYPSAEARSFAYQKEEPQARQITPQDIYSSMPWNLASVARKAAQGKKIPSDMLALLTEQAHKMGISYHYMMQILQ